MPDDEPKPAIDASEPLCSATLDGSAEHRCCRPLGHDGLHRWTSPDGSKKFDWA